MYLQAEPTFTEAGQQCPKCNRSSVIVAGVRVATNRNNCDECERLTETTMLCTNCYHRWREVD